MSRKNISSNAVWEDIVGYSRAVRIGNTIEVSGSVAVNEKNEVVGQGDPYLQAVFILNKIISCIEAAGGKKEDIIRTRIYVTDIVQWPAVGKAHGEVFREIKPATSMVEIKALISKDYLVEIEATAIVS